MTGYGRSEQIVDGRAVTVEIKSVNHRYFEFSCRTTRGYSFLEEKLKSFLQGRITRGKVDAYISVEALESAQTQVLVNHSLAEGYVQALRELAERYGLRDDISVSTVSRYSDIFSVHKAPEDEEAVWNSVQQAAEEAVRRYFTTLRIGDPFMLIQVGQYLLNTGYIANYDFAISTTDGASVQGGIYVPGNIWAGELV